ncbi:MAG: hypothetical protein LQ352_004344 [Teloschistes flavicans]|nr:MAG: hypothetical protein LQ352_004344 [Teloschistes flavicans]
MSLANVSIDKQAYLVSTGVLLGICSVSVITRFYIRIWGQRQFSVDDGFLVVAVCCLICSLVIMYSVAIDKMYQIQELSAALPFALSIGFHIDDMSQDSQFLQDSYDFLKWITVSQALAWCSVMAVKFSFLFLFRKLIERMPPLITYWWFVITFNIVALGYGMSTYFLYCPYFNNPKLYECALPSGVARELRHGVAQTVMDVVSDLLISAEIGVILASISTYRAFYVSRRRSDDIRAGTSRGHQKYRFLPTRQIVKRFFASSPRPSTPRERSSPEDKWQDENARHPMGSLPQIPSAHLTGMRTFIEGHGQWIDSSRIMGSQGIEEIDDDWPLRKEDHNALEQV